MEDLGAPTSYLALPTGVAVFDADGERVGRVDHVLADAENDIFDGLVIDARAGLGGHRFADAEQVAELHERGVLLRVRAAELPEPSANPAALGAAPGDAVERDLTGRLRRAWDWLSGRY